jgi:hypothetical protein
MQRKKHRAKVAQEIRKKFKLPFNESQKMARLLAKGDTLGAMQAAGFRGEAEWTTNCARGCCRGPSGNTLWIKSIGDFLSRKELVIHGEDLKGYEYERNITGRN